MLYSYLVCIDNGGAPCIQDKLLSLSICKPKIRKHAKIGDIIIGICAKSMKLNTNIPQILYIAKITNIVLMETYYNQYQERNDCIYDNNLNLIPNNFHICSNIKTDINGKNVILSNDFIFYGHKHIDIDENFYNIVPKFQGHFSRKNDIYENEFKLMYEKILKRGKIGDHIHSKNKCKINT